MRCPICKKQFDTKFDTVRPPFCSERCKLIDLGRWLDGAYQIPVEGEEMLDGVDPDTLSNRDGDDPE